MGFWQKLFGEDRSSGNSYLEIEQIQEDGAFIDLRLSIRSAEMTDDKAIRYLIEAQWNGQRIGCALVIAPPTQVLENPNAPIVTYSGVGYFVSTGEKTRILAQYLSETYEVPVKVNETRDFPFIYATLDNSAPALQNPKIEMKAMKYGPVSNPNEYWEIYFNFDHKDHSVVFAEKDPEYREALLSAIVG